MVRPTRGALLACLFRRPRSPDNGRRGQTEQLGYGTPREEVMTVGEQDEKYHFFYGIGPGRSTRRAARASPTFTCTPRLLGKSLFQLCAVTVGSPVNTSTPGDPERRCRSHSATKRPSSIKPSARGKADELRDEDDGVQWDDARVDGDAAGGVIAYARSRRVPPGSCQGWGARSRSAGWSAGKAHFTRRRTTLRS